MSTKQVIIIGGHGKVALRLAKLLATDSKHTVTSVIRSADQIPDLKSASSSVQPLVLSLEDSSVSEFTEAFSSKDVVVFAAGSGGNGGLERLEKVDYQGALKVFDAIEALGENVVKPYLVLLSAIDSRDVDAAAPAHYNEDDIQMSKMMRDTIGPYMDAKYRADKNLSQRTSFKWSILRPGYYNDEPGTGKASIGRTHIAPAIPRDDVALALSILVDRPDAAGLAVDMVGGDAPIAQGLDAFIAKGETDFFG